MEKEKKSLLQFIEDKNWFKLNSSDVIKNAISKLMFFVIAFLVIPTDDWYVELFPVLLLFSIFVVVIPLIITILLIKKKAFVDKEFFIGKAAFITYITLTVITVLCMYPRFILFISGNLW